MRYPIIRQHDSADCGPAVLATIAAFYRNRQSIAQLREIAGTDRQGTNLAGLIAAAERIGFEARAVRATAEALPQLRLPAIAHWREGNRNHFVVLYRISPGRVIVGDPALGLRKLTPEDFQKNWTGVLLLIAPTPRLREAIKTQSSLSRLCGLLYPHRRLFLDASLAAVLMTVLGLSSSFFIQALVDYVFVFGRKPALNWLGLGMLLVLFFRVAFLGLRSYLLAHLSQRIDADTVLGFHRHLLGLPLTFFSTRRAGEILARMNDAIKVRIAISATTLSVIVDGLMVATTAAIMFLMHWHLALSSLSLLPILAGAVWLLNAPLKRHQRRSMEKAADVEALVVETIGAIQTIKAFRAEPLAGTRTESRFYEMMEASFRAQLVASHSAAVSSFMVGLATLSVLWLGGRQVLDGGLTVGQLMAMHTLLGTILGPVERLANANQSIQDALIAAERLGEVLELDREIQRQRPGAIDRSIDGSIEFRNVTFRHGSRPPIFEKLSFRIEPGECVGIAGESGSGKTTLVNLLARFFEPVSGKVLIDGIEAQDYTFECLRREIVFVPQDIVLLNGSLAENIRLGSPHADTVEVRDAARAACLGEFIEQLPAGYSTVVGERGISLSGGERQRVAVARAILANPSILILDEPTSHLDSESEAAVQTVIDRRRGIRTTIVISHRPLQVDRLIRLNEQKLFAPAASG